MGGRDAIKGCNFQHACVMEKALDLLGCSGDTKLILEGTADIVDYEIVAGTSIIEVGQIKTKDEPYQWHSSELEPVLREWTSKRPNSDRYAFITNGSAGKDVEKLRDITTLLATDSHLDAEHNEFLAHKFKSVEINGLLRVLSRLHLETRHAGTEDTIKLISYRLKKMGADEETGVERLFLKVAITSGASQPCRRLLTPQDVADAIGTQWPVPLSFEENLTKYREQLRFALSKEEFIPLSYSHQAQSVGTSLYGEFEISFVEQRNGSDRQLSLEDLIVDDQHLAIMGSPGSGKTTSLKQIARRLLDVADLAVLAPASMYRGEPIEKLVADSVTRLAPIPVQDESLRDLLRKGQVVLLLDGLDECPREHENQIFREIRRMLWAYPKIRVIVSSRDPTHARRLGFAEARVKPLDDVRVRNLLRLELGNDSGLFSRLQRSLGSSLYTPLAVKMISGLLAATQNAPRNRRELYDQFLAMLYERDKAKGTSVLSLDMMRWIGTRMASYLQKKGHVAFTWSEFLDVCEELIRRLVQSRRFDTQSMTAEELAEVVSLSAWMRRDYITVSFVHVSFQEFLASGDLSSEMVRQFASDPHWHEVIAFWISSQPPKEVESSLQQLLPIDLGLIGKCWRSGAAPYSLELREYLDSFRRAMSSISKVHFPCVFGGKEVSVFGTLEAGRLVYVVVPAGSKSGILPMSDLVKRLGTAGYLRARSSHLMLGIPPTLAAYRDMLDLVDQTIREKKAKCGPDDIPLNASTRHQLAISDSQFIEYLRQVNSVFEALALSMFPSLAPRMRRPGDLDGYFRERQGNRVFTCCYGKHGAGPRIISESDAESRRACTDIDIDYWVSRNPQRHVLDQIDSELERLLPGYKEADRWRL